jgi:hypothetical protein
MLSGELLPELYGAVAVHVRRQDHEIRALDQRPQLAGPSSAEAAGVDLEAVALPLGELLEEGLVSVQSADHRDAHFFAPIWRPCAKRGSGTT